MTPADEMAEAAEELTQMLIAADRILRRAAILTLALDFPTGFTASLIACLDALALVANHEAVDLIGGVL